RFGVKHKEQLKQLRRSVDVLTLTATPIPRTLHMSLVGLRDMSVMETPPDARLPIMTEIRPQAEETTRDAILRELDRGGQVYVVHNRAETIERAARRIRAAVPAARGAVAHRQVPAERRAPGLPGFAGGRPHRHDGRRSRALEPAAGWIHPGVAGPDRGGGARCHGRPRRGRLPARVIHS